MKTLVNRERLIKTFCELAKIKSPSGQEGEIARNVIKRLKILGISADRDNYGNIIAKIAGFGKPLILCAHLDTVAVSSEKEIKPIIKKQKGRIESDGDTILGADNKDYIAAILEMLVVVKENNFSCCALEIVFTKEEESISKGAKELDYSLLDGKECLISDSSDPYGTITLSAPYYEKFQVTINGKEAHTKDPENGINAIATAVEIISSIPLGRVSKLVTTNIGFILGGLNSKLEDISLKNILGQTCNTIPDIVKFCGEIRGPKKDEFEKISREIRDVLKKSRKGEVEADLERLADGYIHTKDDSFLNQIVKVFGKQGVEPKFIDAIGGSDANIFNAEGIKTVVISSAHRNNHQKSEYLIVNDLVKLTDFLVRFVTQK